MTSNKRKANTHSNTATTCKKSDKLFCGGLFSHTQKWCNGHQGGNVLSSSRLSHPRWWFSPLLSACFFVVRPTFVHFFHNTHSLLFQVTYIFYVTQWVVAVVLQDSHLHGQTPLSLLSKQSHPWPRNVNILTIQLPLPCPEWYWYLASYRCCLSSCLIYTYLNTWYTRIHEVLSNIYSYLTLCVLFVLLFCHEWSPSAHIWSSSKLWYTCRWVRPLWHH